MKYCLVYIATILIISTPLNVCLAEPRWEIPSPRIEIPGMDKFGPPVETTDDKGNQVYQIKWLSVYIAGIYKFAITIVGILAVVVMMWGGIVWITAGGNAGRVDNAKAWIGAAATGLVLTLASYTVLYMVNPNLVTFKPLEITTIGDKTLDQNKVELIGCCQNMDEADDVDKCAWNKTRSECTGSWYPDDINCQQCKVKVVEGMMGCCRITDYRGITCLNSLSNENCQLVHYGIWNGNAVCDTDTNQCVPK